MTAMKIDEAAIRSLAKLLDETGLTEIEIEQGEHSVRVAKGGSTVYATAPAVAATTAPAAAGTTPAANTSTSYDNHPGAVTSPMVGTAYLQPEPSSPAFISVGASIKEGDTLLIVEAMKVMNPIKSTKSGTVKAILVQDAQPVEYGEVLVIIE